MKKLIYIITAFALALSACEKTLDFPIEYKQPKLVLNCVLSNNSEINFTVSRSMHILDSKEIVMIPDADVIIFEDDKPLQVVPVSNGAGHYHASYTPKIGHTYKFQISKDGFETIEAEATMLDPTTINRFSCNAKVSDYDDIYYGNGTYSISINFNDNQQQENYYMIKMTGEFPQDMKDYLSGLYEDNFLAYQILDSTYELFLECNDQSVGRNSDGTSLFIADEIIVGGNYTVKFNAYDYRDLYGIFYDMSYYNSIEDTTGNQGNGIENLPFYQEYEYNIIVHLQVINKDYYQYEKSYYLYNENDGNPFAEPTLVKTNVKNGLGILGSSCEVTDTVKFVIKNPYVEEGEKK